MADPEVGTMIMQNSIEDDERCVDENDRQWIERKLCTKVYGEVDFSSQQTSTNAKYIRVSSETDEAKIFELLTDKWGLQNPKLLISVTGGAQNFEMKPRLREVFRKSLIHAAESTGAWITTGGTHCGVMKHVGKAVKYHASIQNNAEKVVTLGISTWGVINNRKILDRQGYTIQYELNDEKFKGLDPNHSHFILVDDGSEGRYGGEIKFRAALESFIAKGRKTKKTPIVCVMVQGGPGSLETVKESLEEGTPCVLVGGSGQWADILASLCRYSENEITKELVAEVMKENGIGADKDHDPDNILILTRHAAACVKAKALITIFQLQPAGTLFDLDVAILSALLKASEADEKDSLVKQQLELAMAWDRCDIARSEILRDDTIISKSDLCELLFQSLHENKPEFTKLFLEFEATLNHRYMIEHQHELFEMLKNAPIISRLAKQHETDLVDRCLRKLIGKTYKKKKAKSDPSSGINPSDSPMKTRSNVNMRVRLFQWAIMMNNRQLSRLIWEQLKDGISAAIGAVCLLRKMAKRTQFNEVKSDLKAHAFEYENMAINVLQKCFESHPEKCGNLLIYELSDWGRSTCLRMAVSAKAKLFVSQPGVQHVLNKIWMGGLSERTSPFTMILCGLTLVPVITKAVKFEHICPDKPPEGNSEEFIAGNAAYESTLLDANSVTVRSNSPLRRPVSRGPVDQPADSDINNSKTEISDKKLTPWMKLSKFYNAPVVTFWLNVVSYIIFLVLFAYIALSNFFCCVPSWFEIVLAVWVGTLFLEEIRQLFQVESESFLSKIQRYLLSSWNIMDIIAIALFYTSFGLRFYETTFKAGRILFAISFMFYCIRIVHIFAVHKVLGPKLIMVGKMLKDVMFFLYILIVFLLAYGVASQSILYPNEWRVGEVFVGVLYKAYWQIYGELFLEEINYNPATGEYTCSSNVTEINAGMPRCPEEGWIVPVLFAIYLVFANVLLLNLLIAIFSSTYAKIESNTDVIWKFQQYKLIEDYYFRPWLAPPLIFLSHAYIIAKLMLKCMTVRVHPDVEETEQAHAFKIKLSRIERDNLLKWEQWHSETYVQEAKLMYNESTENKIRVISDRVDGLMSSMENMREEMLENMLCIKRLLKK